MQKKQSKVFRKQNTLKFIKVNILKPHLLIIIIISAFSRISESVYTPSIPSIAQDLSVSEVVIEGTITISLIGFAIGLIFFGNLSDKIGRKRCLLIGIMLYIASCTMCYFSNSILTLSIYRFIQAFSASSGSIISQAIIRDTSHGRNRSVIYAKNGYALALVYAIFPIIGGFVQQQYGWRIIFVLLFTIGVAVFAIVQFFLNETCRSFLQLKSFQSKWTNNIKNHSSIKNRNIANHYTTQEQPYNIINVTNNLKAKKNDQNDKINIKSILNLSYISKALIYMRTISAAMLRATYKNRHLLFYKFHKFLSYKIFFIFRFSIFNKLSVFRTASKIVKDKATVGLAVIIACCNGIQFCYYAEGSLYFIKLLGFSPLSFGFTFIATSLGNILGCIISNKMHHRRKLNTLEILALGIIVAMIGCFLFSLSIFITSILELSKMLIAYLTIFFMFIITFGIGLVIPNCLSLSLQQYQHSIGTASSIFNFIYYVLTAVITICISLLHNSTLFVMPCYFLCVSILMWLIFLKTVAYDSSLLNK